MIKIFIIQAYLKSDYAVDFVIQDILQKDFILFFSM